MLLNTNKKEINSERHFCKNEYKFSKCLNSHLPLTAFLKINFVCVLILCTSNHLQISLKR